MKRFIAVASGLVLLAAAFFYLRDPSIEKGVKESLSEDHHEEDHDHSGHDHHNHGPSKIPSSSLPKKGTQSEASPTHFKDSFKKKYPGDWQFAEDERGLVFRVSLEDESSLVIKSDQDFNKFSAAMVQMLELGEGVKLKKDQSAERATDFSVTQVVNQEYQGVPVIDSTLQITKNKEDEVYSIENQLRKIDKDIILEEKYSLKEAEELIRKHFADLTIDQIKPQEKGISPYHQPQELARIFIVRFTGKEVGGFDTHRVAVGLATGKIFNYSVLVQD